MSSSSSLSELLKKKPAGVSKGHLKVARAMKAMKAMKAIKAKSGVKKRPATLASVNEEVPTLY
jgi:hypothetical protein